MVCAESFFHRPGSLCCKSIQVGLATSDRCKCGTVQIVSHIVNRCLLTMLSDGGMQRLYLADDDTVMVGP